MSIDQRWKDTIDAGLKHPARNQHSAVVATEVAGYNKRLNTTSGYEHVDSKLIEAIVWVESGGPKTLAWTGRAMQIGNPGDPGLQAIRDGEGATSEIVTPELLAEIRQASVADFNDPTLNIKTGIAYLFVRMAFSRVESVEASPTVYEYVVQSGDNLSAIAAAHNTTVGAIEKATLEKNPSFNKSTIFPGQRLYYREARNGRVITGWRTFTPQQVAAQYNGGGDPSYDEKLSYVHAKL